MVNSLEVIELFAQMKGLQKNMQPVGALTGSEAGVVQVLLARQAQGLANTRISDLANTLCVTSPGVTQLVTALERKGYVYRETDQLDRRSINVLLTDEGRKVAQEVQSRSHGVWKTIEKNMGQEKLTHLYSLLREAVDVASGQ